MDRVTGNGEHKDRDLTGGPGRRHAAHLARYEIVEADSDMTDLTGTSSFLDRSLRRLLRKPVVLVIDLEQVQRADTKLVACLVMIFREAHRLRIQIEFRMSAAAEAVVRLCRLDAMIQ